MIIFAFFIVLGIILDAILSYQLWLNIVPFEMFSGLHFLAVGLVNMGLFLLLKKSYEAISAAFMLLLVSFGLVMPVLGLIGDCVIVLYLCLLRKSQFTGVIAAVQPIQDIPPLAVRYGIGGLRARLRSESSSSNSKTAALFAMGNMELGQANVLLREALPDRNEDVRLLAFGLLEYQEKDLNQQISKSLHQLDTETDTTSRAHLQKRIAQLYWELIERELNLDLEDLILSHALSHAKQALEVLTDDELLWVLLGKVYHRLKKSKLSKQAFMEAEELGVSMAHFIPYLAENVYYQRDFKKLRALLAKSPTLSDLPAIGPITKFWLNRYAD